MNYRVISFKRRMHKTAKNQMIRMFTSILAMAVFLILSSASATFEHRKIYYFSISGDDKNSGLSEDTPKKTLTAAANLMNPGTTCIVI